MTSRRRTIQALASGFVFLKAAAAAALGTPPVGAGKATDVARPLRLTVASAKLSTDRYTGAPLVRITLGDDSARSLQILTDANQDRILEIPLDGTVLAEPKILETVPGDTFQISGSVTVAEARELAREIIFGGVLTASIRD